MNIQKRKNRERYRVQSNNKRNLPRLFVICSQKNFHAQIIKDSEQGKVLLSISSNQKNIKEQLKNDCKSYNIKGAELMGEIFGLMAKKQNILEVVFDRGHKKFHGRIKAFADKIRENITI